MDKIKEELIAEINKRHHIKISPDDPIFAVLTMNTLISDDMIKKMELLLEMQSSIIAEQNLKLLSDAKQFAQNTITSKVGTIVSELDERYKNTPKKENDKPTNQPPQINHNHFTFSKENITVLGGIIIAALVVGVLIGIFIG